MVDNLVLQIDTDDTADKVHPDIGSGNSTSHLVAIYIIFQLHSLVCPYRCKQGNISGIPAIFQNQLAVLLAIAHDAARIVTCLQRDVIRILGEGALIIFRAREGQGISVLRCQDALRHLRIRIQTGKQTFPGVCTLLSRFYGLPDRFADRGAVCIACKLSIRIGSLVADDASYEGRTADRTQGVLRTKSRCFHVFRQIDHIGADDAADIVMPLDTSWFYDQFFRQNAFRCIEAKAAADCIAASVDPTADQVILYLQASLYIIKARDAAHIGAARHDARYGFYQNLLTALVKSDRTIIVACDTANIVSGSLPCRYNHVIKGAVIIGDVACRVADGRICIVVAYDTAGITVIGSRDAVVDAVLQGDTRFIHARDAADVRVANDIASVCRR